MKLEIEIDEKDIQAMLQHYLHSKNLKLEDTKKLEVKIKKVFTGMKLKVETLFTGYPYSNPTPWYNPSYIYPTYFKLGEIYCGNGGASTTITLTEANIDTTTSLLTSSLITTTSGGAGTPNSGSAFSNSDNVYKIK